MAEQLSEFPCDTIKEITHACLAFLHESCTGVDVMLVEKHLVFHKVDLCFFDEQHVVFHFEEQLQFLHDTSEFLRE